MLKMQKQIKMDKTSKKVISFAIIVILFLVAVAVADRVFNYSNTSGSSVNNVTVEGNNQSHLDINTIGGVR